MLINLSNHPSNYWDKKQTQTAIEEYGSIVDITFPAIDPIATSSEVEKSALEYFKKTTAYFYQCANTPYENAVHIHGEFTFVFKLVTMLINSGIKCIASTSSRNVEITDKGNKIVKFSFVRFRKY